MTNIVNLEKGVRIAAKSNCFVLQVEEDKVWVDKFQYSWIGDALKGYILFSLRRPNANWVEINNLAGQIEKLDTTIKEVDKKLNRLWRIIVTDPIEMEFIND
jgi:hypothetical protein